MQSIVYYVAFLPNNCNWAEPSFPSLSPVSRLRHRQRQPHPHHHPHPDPRIKTPPTSSVTVSSPNSRNHSSKYICSSLVLHSTTSNCLTNEAQLRRQSNNYKSNHRHPCPQYQETLASSQFHVSVEAGTRSDPHPGEQQPEDENQFKKTPGLFSNMWWADLKAAAGQRINVQGIVSSAGTFFKDRHLALPHVAVPDIRYIDWTELSRRGFEGVVFDKDNTITVPYTLTLSTPLASSVEQCKSVFGSNVAVFSNSAGLYEYDSDGSKARALEKAIGIRVIRHSVKKPAGTAEEIEKHFGCKSSQLVMVGDRPFTDIVYGNRNGFFTILTEPLSLAEEPFIVRQVRKLEIFLVDNWLGRGLKPISHCLLSDVRDCVKDLPTM